MSDLVRAHGFLAALVAGLVVSALVAVLVRRRFTCLGYAFVVLLGTLVGFRVQHLLSAALVVALALLVFGELLAGRVHSWWASFVFAIPGALVLAAALPDDLSDRLHVGVVVATLLLGPLVVVSGRRDPRLVALLLAVSACGMYVCTPDTEHARALVGGALAAALLVLDRRLPATIGLGALTGLFVWSAAIDGRARGGAFVGAVACLGVVLLMPLVGWRAPGRVAVVVAVGVQLALVAYEARLAGFQDSAVGAALATVPAFVVAGAVLWAAGRRASRPRGQP